MGKIRKFKEVLGGGVGTSYDANFKGHVVRDIRGRLDGTVQAAGGGGITGLTVDAPFGILNRFKFLRSTESMFDVDPPTLYHLAGLLNGRYPAKLSPTPGAGASGAIQMEFGIPLSKLFPNVMIDARLAEGEVAAQGNFGAATTYASTNVAAFVTNLRLAAETSDILPDQVGGHMVPYVVDLEIDLSTASGDANEEFNAPFDMVVAGVMVRTNDDSAAGDAKRTDGLVRRVIIEANTPEDEATIYDLRWGEGKALTGEYWSIEQDVLKPGVIWCPTMKAGGARRLSKSSVLKFRMNTTDAVEADFTAVAPAAQDKAFITIVGARPFSKAGKPLPVFKAA